MKSVLWDRDLAASVRQHHVGCGPNSGDIREPSRSRANRGTGPIVVTRHASVQKEHTAIKSLLFVAFAGVLCLATVSGATAEPIDILSGSLVFTTGFSQQLAPLSMAGTRGFSVVGAVDTGEDLLDPILSCRPCPVASTMHLDSGLGGSGFFDTNLTFEGRTFENIGSQHTEAFLFLRFVGSVFVPEVGQSPIVLSASFRLQDPDSRLFGAAAVDSVPIRGGGIVTMGLEPRNDSWVLQSARYDFAAQATPEPATVMLFGSGLAGIAFRNRRRQNV